MAEPASTADPGSGRAVRLLGVETEYGFAVLGSDGERLDPADSADALMRETRALVPNLPCSSPRDVFTANGSRVYIDYGLHPEVATSECSTPEEVVRFSRAGDLLLARAARAVERTWTGDGVQAVLWKANVDHRTGATWGAHESYLHEVPQLVLVNQLISHLVTRLIYTGAGGFGNRSRELRFVISPRALHLEREVSKNSTGERGIFHTRDERLAAGGYRRLHVLAGESLWSETADYLRVGTTALLIAQIDAGRRPQAGLDLASPLEALAKIANDAGCHAALPMKRGARRTAIEIQRCLLNSVEVDLGARHLPAWAPAVCDTWRLILERLENAPSSLVGVLDWPTKLAVLKHWCEAQGVEWTFSAAGPGGETSAPSGTGRSRKRTTFATGLLEIDMRFNRLDENGIFTALDRENVLCHRIVTPEAIERAVREPPATGRARIRAACIERLASKPGAASCSWEEIIDHERGQRLVLGDPFQCEGEKWTPMPESESSDAPDLNASLEPIQRALEAGVPRDALRHMHDLIISTQPLTDTSCHYCVTVLASFVPRYPVPVLRHGAATAGSVLEALFEHVTHEARRGLEERVGTLLYRFHEARGAYDRAGQVIGYLLSRASEQEDTAEVAMLTNNLGYEYLLASDWATAIPLFERAARLFEQASRPDELPSVRANLFECRFGQHAHVLDRWMEFVPDLKHINRVLLQRCDWRARKTLMLLARLAHSRGRRSAAIAWTRRALTAADGVPTQLAKWDGAFLETLQQETEPP